MIIAMDNVPGSNAQIGGDTTSQSSLEGFDRIRHGQTHGASYLWLDLHASTRRLSRDELIWHLQVRPHRAQGPLVFE